MGMPGDGKERRGNQGGSENPDRHRDERPGAAADVERAKAQAEEDGKVGRQGGRAGAVRAFIHDQVPGACGWVDGSSGSRTTGCGQCVARVRRPDWPCHDWEVRMWFHEKSPASDGTWK